MADARADEQPYFPFPFLCYAKGLVPLFNQMKTFTYEMTHAPICQLINTVEAGPPHLQSTQIRHRHSMNQFL